MTDKTERKKSRAEQQEEGYGQLEGMDPVTG